MGAAGLLAGVGCGSTAPRPAKPDVDLHHPSATRRLEAVTVTEKQRDLAQVPTLIEMLDDEDPAVRLSAGSTLTTLTGHETGYRPFAPREERQRQVVAWRSWWAGQGHGSAAPSPGSAVVSPAAPTKGATHGGPP